MGNTIQNTLNDVKETTKEDMIEISHTISGTGERLAKTGTYITGLFPSLFDKTHSVVVGTTNFMLGGIDVLIPRDFSLYYPKLHQWVALDPLVENLQHGKIFMHKNRVILIGIRSKKWKVSIFSNETSRSLRTTVKDIIGPSYRRMMPHPSDLDVVLFNIMII